MYHGRLIPLATEVDGNSNSVIREERRREKRRGKEVIGYHNRSKAEGEGMMKITVDSCRVCVGHF